MRRLMTLMLMVLVAMSLAVPAALAQVEEDSEDLDRRGNRNAKITVVHGIPGDALGLDKALPVDVCLDDEDGNAIATLIPGFEFKDVEVLEVPAGAYPVSVRLADATECAGAAVLAAPLTVSRRDRVSVVANLTADGQPGLGEQLGSLPIGLSVFEDKTRGLRWFQARLAVRHTADAPAVDVWQGRFKGTDNEYMRSLFTEVENGEGGDRKFWFGRRYVGLAIAPSASPADIAVGPVKLWLPRRSNTTVYAVGSLSAGSGSPFGLGSFDFIVVN